MILKRANSESFLTRLRLFVWPRRSFSRSFKYFGKRLLRLRASPHAIAVGIAAGVFASCSPLLGLHILIAVSIAWILSGNLVAAALGTAFCNPLTFPFIITADIKLGALFLNKPHVTPDAPNRIGNLWGDIDFAHFWHHMGMAWQPLLKPLLLGSIPVGVFCALITYFVSAYFIKLFKKKPSPNAVQVS